MSAAASPAASWLGRRKSRRPAVGCSIRNTTCLTPSIAQVTTHQRGSIAASFIRSSLIIALVLACAAIPASATTVYLTQGTTSWVVPSDWDSSNNTIEAIGAGGSAANAGGCPTAGGNGGDYAKITNLTLTPGATVTVAIGAGSTHNSGTAGGDTYLCNATSNCASIAGSAVQVGAKGGNYATNQSSPTAQSTANDVGTTKHAGGQGGGGSCSYTGGSGAGAAGPNGNGAVGAPENTLNTTGPGGGGDGNGGAQVGGTGGTAWDGTAGGAPDSPGAKGSHGSGGGGGSGTGAPKAAGDGGDGTDLDASHGSGGGGGAGSSSGGAAGAAGNGGLYGGGAAGATWPSGSAGDGANGLLAINYSPVVTGPPVGTLMLLGVGK